MDCHFNILVRPEIYEPYDIYIDRVRHMVDFMNTNPSISSDELVCESMKYMFFRLYECKY